MELNWILNNIATFLQNDINSLVKSGSFASSNWHFLILI